MPQSRISRLEEKRTKKQLFLVTVGIVILILALITIGIPLVVRISVFLGNLKSTEQVDSSDKTSPLSPMIAPIPEATNSATVKVEGYAEPETNLNIFVNGLAIDSVLVGNDGDFEFSHLELQSGDNSIYAIAVDAAGNESPKSNEQTVKYLKTGPTMEVSEPKDGQEFGRNFETIQIKGKTDSEVNVRINERFVAVAEDGSFIFNLKLSEGENKISIKATDIAGNINEKELKVTYKPE
jgi:predicted  nucleic acid-binding Zn-ribbon protein